MLLSPQHHSAQLAPGIAQLQRGIAAPGVQYVLDGLLQGAADVVSRLELSIHDAAANAVHDFECGFRAEVGCLEGSKGRVLLAANHHRAAASAERLQAGQQLRGQYNQQVLELLQRVIGLVQIPKGEQLIQHLSSWSRVECQSPLGAYCADATSEQLTRELCAHPEALPRLARPFEHSVCVRNSLFLQHTDGLLKRPGAAFCG